MLLTSSRRRCTERLPTGVHHLLDSRGRYTAHRRDVALAPLDNVEPDDTGKKDSTPQLPPLVLMEQISEHPEGQRYGRKNHRPILASPRWSNREFARKPTLTASSRRDPRRSSTPISARQPASSAVALPPPSSGCIPEGSRDRGVAQMGAKLAANGHRRPATPNLITPNQTANQASSAIVSHPTKTADSRTVRPLRRGAARVFSAQRGAAIQP